VISHIKYELIGKQGISIALLALAHKDVSVKERGIRCFENWYCTDIEVINDLKHIDIKEKWLQSYLKDVIAVLDKYGELK
jgi:hypothetical protein